MNKMRFYLHIDSYYNQHPLRLIILLFIVQIIIVWWYIDSKFNEKKLVESNTALGHFEDATLDDHVIKFSYPGKATVSFLIDKYSDTNAKSFEILMSNELKLIFTYNDVILADSDESYGFVKKANTDIMERLSFLNFDEYRNSYIKLWISFHGFNPYFIKVGYGEIFENNTLFKFEAKKTKGIQLLKQISSIQIDKFLVISDLVFQNEGFILDMPYIINSLNKLTVDNVNSNFFLLNPMRVPNEIQELQFMVSSFNLNIDDLDAISFAYHDREMGLFSKFISNKQNSPILMKFLQSNKYIISIEIYPESYTSSIIFHKNEPFGVYKVLNGEFNFKWFNSISGDKFLKKNDITWWISKQVFNTVQIKNTNENEISILLKVVYFPDGLNENMSIEFDFDLNEVLNQLRNDYVRSKKSSNQKITIDRKNNSVLDTKEIKFDSIGQGLFSFKINSYNFQDNNQYFSIKLENINLNFSYNNVRIDLDQSYGFQEKRGKKSVNYLNFNMTKSTFWMSFNGFGSYFIKIGYGFLAESNVLCKFETNETRGINLLQGIRTVTLGDSIKIRNLKQENRAFIFDPPLMIADLDKNKNFILEKSNSITSHDLSDRMNLLLRLIKNFYLSSNQIEAINFSMQNQNCFLYEQTKNQESKISIKLDTNENLKSKEFELFIEIYPRKYALDQISRIKDVSGIYRVLAGAFNFSWYNTIDNSNDKINSSFIFRDDIIRLLPEVHEINKLDNIQSELASVILKGFVRLNNINSKISSFKIEDILKKAENEYEKKSCNGSDLITSWSFRSIRNKNYINMLLESTNELQPSFKQLKACDEWHKNEFYRKGKGTIRFRYENLDESFESFNVLLGDIEIILTFDDVRIKNAEMLGFKKITKTPKPHSLIHFDASEFSIWISFFAFDTYFIKIGYGYVWQKNVLFEFTNNSNSSIFMNRLKNINTIEIDYKLSLISKPKMFEDALIIDPPPFVINIEDYTLKNINESYRTVYDLSKSGQFLYSKVAGSKISLTDEEIEAINYSLDNHNCKLRNILNSKTSFPGAKTSYIRSTFMLKEGNSPGHQFVLEIWPKDHSSPIHNHGDTTAIIKVLHGEIYSEFYNPLAEKSGENPHEQLIMSTYLQKGNVTWLTSEYYQTHRLWNRRNDTCAITLQSYAYSEDDKKYDDKFHYILPDKERLQDFSPNQDVEIFKMLEEVKNEYRNKNCDFALDERLEENSELVDKATSNNPKTDHKQNIPVGEKKVKEKNQLEKEESKFEKLDTENNLEGTNTQSNSKETQNRLAESLNSIINLGIWNVLFIILSVVIVLKVGVFVYVKGKNLKYFVFNGVEFLIIFIGHILIYILILFYKATKPKTVWIHNNYNNKKATTKKD